MKQFRPLIFIAAGFFLVAMPGSPARAQERIMLHGTLNNKAVSFLYDTGSIDSLLFRNPAERLGLQISHGQGDNADSVEDCTTVFGGESKKMRLAVRDRPSAGYFKDGIDGVLSWLDLDGQVFQIDYEKNAIGAIAIPANLKGWEKWKLAAGARVLLFDCSGGRETVRIGIDTGYPGGVILGDAKWEKWRAEHAGAPATNVALVTSGNAVVVNDVLRVKRISLGALALDDIPVTKAPPSIDALFGHCDAILGIDALKRLKIIIDRKNGVLYTAPIHIAADFGYNKLGAVFVPDEAQAGWHLIARVAAGSPAYEAGIRDQDALVKVEKSEFDKGAETLIPVPFHTAMFQPAGTKLVVTLKRNDQTFSVMVTLKEPDLVE